MRVLVTGGAGYIGSFMVHRLQADGHQVVVLDSLERSKKEKIPEGIRFIQGSLLEKEALQEAFSEPIDAVIHFAAYISVGESAKCPGIYFKNNVEATINLLEKMVEKQVSRIVFSSSAAVYGNPQTIPIPEDHPKNPESPYGESKLMVERILYWYYKSNNISSVSLRYFNASGAALDGSLGETHDPETHIIPNAIKAALHNTSFTLFGTDYDTKDGTCIRDYIHVVDLVQAHLLAVEKLQKGEGAFSYNVGTGEGYSNQEVLQMVEEVSGKQIVIEKNKRREGDPAQLIADPKRIREELGFQPQHSDLRTIVTSAFKWHSK